MACFVTVDGKGLLCSTKSGFSDATPLVPSPQSREAWPPSDQTICSVIDSSAQLGSSTVYRLHLSDVWNVHVHDAVAVSSLPGCKFPC